jgi:hypothetical protein
MSITTPDTRITTYEPVVATTEFAATFPVFDNTDLAVFVNGAERTDFIVSATYQEGISNDASVILASGVVGKVLVVGERAARRGNRFTNGAPLPIWAQNLALDALEAESQEQARDIGRAIKAPYGEEPQALPAPDGISLLGWSPDNKLVNRADAGDSAARAEAARDAALGAVPNAFAATRTILKAFDTNTITAAYLKENGRVGQFIWKTGDYSAQIAADPLEGIFIKADAVAATAGAWVRQAGYFLGGIDVRWFGAIPESNPQATTTAIQRALNLAAFLGVGRVVIPGGEWRLSKTQTETFLTTAMPDGFRDQYALLVPSGILLEGEGFKTVLKRYVAEALVVVLCANTTGTKVTNLRVDGNQTLFPISGDTYGSGAGVFLESGTGTEDRDNIIDTVWIRDTPGYGLAAEWGNHRGLVLRNIFINGTGSDGIDIKRMNSGAFEAYAIVLDTILVEDFGRTATDAAQAGIDLRGYFTASNLHVRKYGAKARAGIRLRGGIAADTILGAMRSVLSNFRVERVSGGEATTFGLEVNPDFVSADNGVVDGCTDNFRCVLAGVATTASGIELSNCKSFNASRNGFRIDPAFRGVRLVACSDIQTAVTAGNAAFRIEGLDTKLVTPYIRALSGLPIGIQIVSGAQRTGVIQPTYEGGVTTPLSDAGTGTVVL